MKRTPLKRKAPMSRASKPMPRSSQRLRRVRAKKEHPRPVVDDGFGLPYLHYIETLPCCVAHLGGCWGDVVGHHVRKGHAARIHRKAVPLCYWHHIGEWHQRGRVRPMTNTQTVVLFVAEIEHRNEDWRQAA